MNERNSGLDLFRILCVAYFIKIGRNIDLIIWNRKSANMNF